MHIYCNINGGNFNAYCNRPGSGDHHPPLLPASYSLRIHSPSNQSITFTTSIPLYDPRPKRSNVSIVLRKLSSIFS